MESLHCAHNSDHEISLVSTKIISIKEQNKRDRINFKKSNSKANKYAESREMAIAKYKGYDVKKPVVGWPNCSYIKLNEFFNQKRPRMKTLINILLLNLKHTNGGLTIIIITQIA